MRAGAQSTSSASRRGSIDSMPSPPDLTLVKFAGRVKYFWSKVDQRGPDECWSWKDWGAKAGRPTVYWCRIEKKQIVVLAAHFAYWLAHGIWPTYVEHTCDNGLCMNSRHLLDSNHQANMKAMADRGRAANTKKTHCPQGHAYAEHGVIRHRGDGKAFRVCKICVLLDTWQRRGGPSARSEGRDLNPVCPRCGGPWTERKKGRICLPCRAAYLRQWRAGR